MFETIGSHTVYTPGLTNRPVVVDLGAHRAEFATAMHGRYSGTYCLVEANPLLAQDLNKQAVFPVWQCAVTDSDGELPFNIAKNDTGSSILALPEENRWNCVLDKTVSVRSARLESLLSEMGVSRVDVLKMDIEGAEVMVLQSLPSETLRAIGQITVEFHSAAVFGFDLADEVSNVVRRLRREGFLYLDFSDNTRLDVLFVNRTFHRISWVKGRFWELRQSPPKWLLGLWGGLPASLRDRIRRGTDRLTRQGIPQ
jgi:FkbM family methyltransferase